MFIVTGRFSSVKIGCAPKLDRRTERAFHLKCSHGRFALFSLWFPSFDEAEILPRTVSVLRQIPFSPARDGVTYAAIQPVS